MAAHTGGSDITEIGTKVSHAGKELETYNSIQQTVVHEIIGLLEPTANNDDNKTSYHCRRLNALYRFVHHYQQE